ncbi:MAG: S8 family serine peptidase [Deltaproteobacteria bacterium]|nr:S8 family serine peptidase [Deltaproteobacteria bacterium]MBI4373240.1 S8 family serine peptidase [Deltaproteobacteria bacterium]
MKSTLWLGFLIASMSLSQATANPPPIDPPGLESVPPCLDPESMPDAARVPCRAILIFSEGTAGTERNSVAQAAGAVSIFSYGLIPVLSVYVPDEEVLETLLSNPEILEVIPDRLVRAIPEILRRPGGGGGSTAAQTVSAGVTRIGAAPGLLPYTGVGVGVAIVDTGLDFAHADLPVSPNCFTAYTSCQDDQGHGTHVGGIVAAKNNSQDAVGVAPGAILYSVKVLNAQGSGYDSDIMAGLDWIGQNANTLSPMIRVANLSLGRSGDLNDNPPMRELFRILSQNLGITVTVAAGNDRNLEVSDQVPATYPEVLSIASSTARDGANGGCRFFTGTIGGDTASYFTSDGAFDSATGIGVTVSAPGNTQEDVAKNCFIKSKGILSLKLGGGTTEMSGTSMAAPHAAGVSALLQEQWGGLIDSETVRGLLRGSSSRAGVAPLDSPASGYSFDGEREGILSACGALGITCP